MKKILTYGVLAFYLIFIFGFTFELHSCMGSIVSFSIVGKKPGCGKCGMTAHEDTIDSCCQDYIITAKVSNAHLSSSLHVLVNSLFIEHLSPVFGFDPHAFKKPKTLPLLAEIYAPPGEIPYYLKYRNLRI